jgi:SAM-dependent methyltransferase
MKYVEKWTRAERKAMQVIQAYTYTNCFVKNITLWAHSACRKLREQGKDIVLDLGCGTGDHFPYVNSRKIIGVDINEDRLKIARERYPHADIRHEDIFNLSFPNGSVSSIVSIGTLEHLDPLNDALQNIHRVLAQAGEFIFCIPTEGYLYRLGRNIVTKRHVEKVTGVDYNALLRKEHINRCQDILVALKKYFVVDKLLGVPFKWPIISLNIFIVGRCLKKPE